MSVSQIRTGLSIAGTVLDHTGLTASLDETRVPFASANVTMPRSPEALALLDPDDSPRVTLDLEVRYAGSDSLADLTAGLGPAARVADLTALWAGQSLAEVTGAHEQPWNAGPRKMPRRRRMNLTVRSRTDRRAGAELTVNAASGEQVLAEYALLAEGPIMAGPTLRDAARLAIGTAQPGAVLEVPNYEGAETAQGREITAVDSRIWEPGVSAWDWLTGVITAHGYRVWCDDQGVFHLHRAETVVAYPEALLSTTLDVATLDDAVDRDTSDYAEAVIVTYEWTDAAGVRRVRYDMAGSGHRVAAFTRSTPYPGPGEAAHRLENLRRKARTLTLTAALDPVVAPAQHAVVSTPTEELQGWISGVTFAVPADEMTVNVRDIEEW